MRKRISLILLLFLFNFALFKKEIDLELKNILLNYYNNGDLDLLDIEAFKKMPKKNFESCQFNNTEDIIKTRMLILKTGKYEINCAQTNIWLYNEQGQLITNFKENDKIYLLKDNLIYAQFLHLGNSEKININIKYLNEFNLPFDPINMKKESDFDTTSVNYDPLKSSEIKYQKRQGDYLYINSNNPETVSVDYINKAFIRLDISNKEVFFTFEHNTKSIKDRVLYSGFQVRNTGNDNLQIKIRNIGFQYNGKGAWLGQKEWIDFFGLKFKMKNFYNWNEAQRKRFIDYFNFDENYEPTPFQTRTYTIPPNEYFYVIGGTTEDAYNNINVFNTADIDIKDTVLNGVVLFEVKGNAEGAYFIYDNITIPQTDLTSYQGYITKNNKGQQYIGYDDCHGVVDNSMTWEFNDKSKEQYFPIKYKVSYRKNAPIDGQVPYQKIETTEYEFENNYWVSHLNPHNNAKISEKDLGVPVGNDMTKFITINETGDNICLDNEHYDGTGSIGNFGNWMIDYIDNFNFVNRGDKPRNVSINLRHGFQGSLACFIRNSKLEIIKGTEQNTIICPKSDNKNDAIDDRLIYNLTVEPHSVSQIYVEYVNLANSYGNITHFVYLDGIKNKGDYFGYNIIYNIFYIILLFGFIW